MPAAYPFYPYPPYSPYQHPSLPPPYVPPAPAAVATALPAAPTATHISSLPIFSDGEESVDKLDEYFAWLARLNSTKAEGLTHCLQTFKEQDIVIGIVNKIKDEL